MEFKTLTSLEYFSTLVADDASLPLLEAAVSVGQLARPDLDVESVLGQIDALAERLRRRIPADMPALQRLMLLNRFFFEDQAFTGNVNDYNNPDNSYLDQVLVTRRGIPITLALIYAELANQVGLRADGVSFPGHFLVKLRVSQGEVVMDPFHRCSLSSEALDERLQPYREQHGLVGDFDVPLGLFLRPASPRETIARLLRNLKHLHLEASRLPEALGVMDRLVALLPDEPTERRDRGLLLVRLSCDLAAMDDLLHYVQACPDADDLDEIRAQMAELRPGARGSRH